MYHHKTVFSLWVLCSLFITNLTHAEPHTDKVIERVKQRLNEDLPRSIGSAAAILHQGKVIYQKIIGHEYKGGPAITADTYFSLGSGSKALTALIMHDLVNSNKIKLDTPLTSLIPRVPKDIQVQHILSHTSGYRYRGNSDIELGMGRPELLDKLFKTKPESLPGHNFIYNNTVYSLLEDAASKAIGKPWPIVFHEGLEKRGLAHLKLMDPGIHSATAYPHHFNKHTKILKQIGRLPKEYCEEVSSSAGVFGSLNDLITFAKLQLTGEFDAWHEPRTLAVDAQYWGLKLPFSQSRLKSSYALGWRVFELKDDKTTDSRMVFHGGYLTGVSAFVGFMKKHDLAIVILTNDDQFTPQRVGFFLWSEMAASSQHTHIASSIR